MPAPVRNYVEMTIARNTVGVKRQGFGIPLILSATASFAERVKSYADLEAVAVDFPSTTGPEYLAAQAAFSQDPQPNKVCIGRSANKPTLKYTCSVTGGVAYASTHYLIDVHGDGVTTTEVDITSAASTYAALVHSQLVTALNAVVGKNFTATFPPLVVADFTFTGEADDDTLTAVGHPLNTGDGPVRVSNSGGALPTGLSAGVDYWVIRTGANTFKLATSLANALALVGIDLTTDGTGTQTLSDTASTVNPGSGFIVTGDAAGEWFSLAVDPTYLSISQTHVDPGVAADLTACRKASREWYGLYTLYNSLAYVEAAADWTEANGVAYVADTNSTLSISQAVGGAGYDVLDMIHTNAYNRTMGVYAPDPSDMMGIAWLGVCLPNDPGSYTFAIKELAGVATVELDATQRGNITDKNGNSYELVADLGTTFDGKTGDGEFLDTRVGLDWLEDDMTKGVFAVKHANKKVPYTGPGIAMEEAAMRASLKRGVRRGVLADDPAPTTTVPKIADIDDQDIADRILPDMKFSGRIAGAVHKTQLRGSVTGA